MKQVDNMKQPQRLHVGRYNKLTLTNHKAVAKEATASLPRKRELPCLDEAHERDEDAKPPSSVGKTCSSEALLADPISDASTETYANPLVDPVADLSTALYATALAADLCEMKQEIMTTKENVKALQSQMDELKSKREVAPSMLAEVMSAWNNFFHARVGHQAILLGSRMRIAYALLVIVDKILLTFDLDEFMSPTNGFLPLWSERGEMENRGQFTVLQLFPESDSFLWLLHWIGLIQAILLLLGVAPRFNGFGVFLSHVWFQHHNSMLFDGQDVMFRLWAFHLLFLPIHRLTAANWIRHCFACNSTRARRELQRQQESYPIWPFRLLQIQICMVYLGAAGAKWMGEQWPRGTALFYLVHTDDFYGRFFNPDFLFNYMFSLKLLTYSTLIIETIVPILVWPRATRQFALHLIMLLHLGMDMSLNMHCFEWLTIWAWCSFYVEPMKGETSEGKIAKT